MELKTIIKWLAKQVWQKKWLGNAFLWIIWSTSAISRFCDPNIIFCNQQPDSSKRYIVCENALISIKENEILEATNPRAVQNLVIWLYWNNIMLILSWIEKRWSSKSHAIIKEKSRDNSSYHGQWSNELKCLVLKTGQPWLKVAENHHKIKLSKKNKATAWKFCRIIRNLIQLRKGMKVISRRKLSIKGFVSRNIQASYAYVRNWGWVTNYWILNRLFMVNLLVWDSWRRCSNQPKSVT